MVNRQSTKCGKRQGRSAGGILRFTLAALCAAGAANAATLYVDPASPGAAAPYGTWETAATDIQTAIDCASSGDEIVLAATTFGISSQILVTNSVTIRGCTGAPEGTVVKNTVTSGNNKSQRVFKVTAADVSIRDLTVSDGFINVNSNSGVRDGGGIYIFGAGATVSNCVVRNCHAWYWGTLGCGIYIDGAAADALVTHCVVTNCPKAGAGGAGVLKGTAIYMDAGTVRNCLLAHNNPYNLSAGSTLWTAYVNGGTLESCTIAGNASGGNSGVYAGSGATVRNCVIAGNTAETDAGAVWGGTESRFSGCLTDIAAVNGCLTATTGGIFTDFDGADYRPSAVSPAVNAASEQSWMAGATDLDGNSRIRGSAPDIGCYEIDPDAFACAFSATTATDGFAPLVVTFSASVANASGTPVFWFDWDGDGEWDESTTETDKTHTFGDLGDFPVSMKVVAGNGESTAASTVKVRTRPETLYVDPASPGAAAPYGTWETAATDIQTAIDYAIDGCEIVLAATTFGVSSEILVNNSVTIRGRTGAPEGTVVKNTVTSGSNKSQRVFKVTAAGASIRDLTVSDGFINVNTSSGVRDGAGIYISGAGATVSNCIVRNCNAWYWGTQGAGIRIDGEATDALVTHCIITNCPVKVGSGELKGGAIYMNAGTVRNCLFAHNSPAGSGQTLSWTAYVNSGTLENCTVVANDATNANHKTGVYAGSGATVRNCVIAGNTAPVAQNAVWGGTESRFSGCLADLVAVNGSGTATAAEIFKDFPGGDFRLKSGSPAINKGETQDWMAGATDLDGNPRLYGKTVDIGCYESRLDLHTVMFFR